MNGYSGQPKPLLMTNLMLKKALMPFTKRRQVLIDYIDDIWMMGTPTPNVIGGNQSVKIIFPQHFLQFVEEAGKMNG